MNAILIERKKAAFGNHGKVVDHEFDLLKWVLRAASKDALRHNLRGVNVDADGTFVATDGHRLHFAKIEKYLEAFPPGVWQMACVHNGAMVFTKCEAPGPIFKVSTMEGMMDPILLTADDRQAILMPMRVFE